jgi:tetratricopeptide repeat protein 21B
MISLKENNYVQAEGALEQAISQNFKIRNNPVFMLLKGEVELKSGNYKVCLQTLEGLFLVPGVRMG